MNESLIWEMRRRIEQLDSDLDAVRQLAMQAIQQYPRAWSQGQPPTGAGTVMLYWAVSDGASVATGTWPSLSGASFTSDVYDSAMALDATGATVLWLYKDALTVSGALVPCIKLGEGSYVGILESCSAVT